METTCERRIEGERLLRQFHLTYFLLFVKFFCKSILISTSASRFHPVSPCTFGSLGKTSFLYWRVFKSKKCITISYLCNYSLFCFYTQTCFCQNTFDSTLWTAGCNQMNGWLNRIMPCHFQGLLMLFTLAHCHCVRCSTGKLWHRWWVLFSCNIVKMLFWSFLCLPFSVKLVRFPTEKEMFILYTCQNESL